MFNKEDILARLRAGTSQEDLAQELTNALNEASADYEAEQKAQEEKEAQNKTKRADTEELVDHIVDYLGDYYPNLVKVFEDEPDYEKMIDDVITVFDSLAQTDEIICEVQRLFDEPTGKKHKNWLTSFFN